MKGLVGLVNIDMNLCFCMVLIVVGYKWVFGIDIVLGNYEDFEQVDLIVFVGLNLVWCYLVLYQCIFVVCQICNIKIVVIDL